VGSMYLTSHDGNNMFGNVTMIKIFEMCYTPSLISLEYKI
jgi:hypothetical protein